jgi:hypothetical protein
VTDVIQRDIRRHILVRLSECDRVVAADVYADHGRGVGDIADAISTDASPRSLWMVELGAKEHGFVACWGDG